MADKIRGITIEIGGDTSGLTKSLKGVNSDLNSTQKQLKDVEKLLKLDPTNTELLRQKQQLLAKQVSQTKDKLTELKNIQDKMDENGVDKNSEQYQALQREIISTENSLKDLESASEKANTTVAKIAATAEKVSEGAQKIADKTKALSAAAAAGIAAIGSAAYDTVVLADDLNTLAKQTGFTTSELQKMYYAADLIDVSVDDITGSMKKLKKNLTSTSSDVTDAFKALGISVYDANGYFRDSSDIYWEVIDSLGMVTNETERDTLAMTLLGKSADSLAGIVDDGGEALKELGYQAESLGLILSQDTLDSLNEVNDEIDTLKANAKATLSEAGAKAVEALLPVIEKIVDKIAELLEWIGSLDTEQIQLILTILTVVALISPIASIISGITSAISTLAPLISSLVTMIGPLISSVVAFCAANPIVLAIAAIVAAITALVVFFVKNWEYVKMLFSMVGDWIDTNVIQPVVRGFETAFTALGNMLSSFWNGIVKTVRAVVNGVIGLIENAINAAIAKVNAVINAFNAVISAVARLVGTTASGISTIKSVKLPKMAKGGTLTSGSAIVGEAGPELLTMVGNKAQVTPLTATLSDKALSALNGSNGKTVTNVNVEFTGSLSQLASVLHPYITAETGRIGTKLINA